MHIVSIAKSPLPVNGGTSSVPGYIVVAVSFLLVTALLLLVSILGAFAGIDGWWTATGLFFLRSYGLFSLYVPALCIMASGLIVQQQKKPASVFVLASSIVPFLTIAVAYSLLSGDAGIFEDNAFFSFLGPRGFKLFMTILVILQIAIIMALSAVLFDREEGVSNSRDEKGTNNPDRVLPVEGTAASPATGVSALASFANAMSPVPPLASLAREGDFYSVDGRLEELDAVEDTGIADASSLSQEEQTESVLDSVESLDPLNIEEPVYRETDTLLGGTKTESASDNNTVSRQVVEPSKAMGPLETEASDTIHGFTEVSVEDLEVSSAVKKVVEPKGPVIDEFEQLESLETVAFDKAALDAPLELDDGDQESSVYSELAPLDIDADDLIEPYEDIDVPDTDEVVDVSRFIGREGGTDEVLTVDEFLSEDIDDDEKKSETIEHHDDAYTIDSALDADIDEDYFEDEDNFDGEDLADESLADEDSDDLSRALTEAEERAREKSRALVEAKTREVEHMPIKKHQNWDLPVEELLTAYPDGEYWVIDQATKDAAVILKETLEEFKIRAEVTGIRKGPVITMFEILPAPGVKLSKIVNLQDNIALRLAASSVRIVAPIPGKHAVGIEVPNRKRNIVSFREMIEGELAREGKKHEIPVILGKDITGEAQTLDLVQTPHLLIAGSTGSGKSVCVNSMILSILYQRSPAECRLILIDPKIVELKLYNDIPHLLTPVITEPKRAFQALQYCIYEMERRYALLDSMGVRDIRSYNRRIKERGIATEHLPYIVVVIDEFADLMATTGKELESTVARLAAMSRAVGIHLVLATQRPSIDVITGLIKANIPSRIAFMVASKMDSRIIIDMVGAEKLLGKGDMLFASAWDPFPVRMQGAFVSEEEVERVVEHVKTLGAPDYIDEEIFYDDDEVETEPGIFGEGDDPLYEKALEIVMQQGKASASYIQRRLKIGYNRAARLVELMEDKGIVGPTQGSKPRELLRGS